jgi:hypothetical protein
MRSFPYTIVQKIKTHFTFKYFFLIRAVREIMWKNMVEPEKQIMAMQYGAKKWNLLIG